MQATLQAQYEPLALMPAAQQMQRQKQAQYQPPMLMPMQHMQPSGQDAASMQRQMPAWQARQPASPQLLQLPYTSHNNPAAQQEMYLDEQVIDFRRHAVCTMSCFKLHCLQVIIECQDFAKAPQKGLHDCMSI